MSASPFVKTLIFSALLLLVVSFALCGPVRLMLHREEIVGITHIVPSRSVPIFAITIVAAVVLFLCVAYRVKLSEKALSICMLCISGILLVLLTGVLMYLFLHGHPDLQQPVWDSGPSSSTGQNDPPT